MVNSLCDMLQEYGICGCGPVALWIEETIEENAWIYSGLTDENWAEPRWRFADLVTDQISDELVMRMSGALDLV